MYSYKIIYDIKKDMWNWWDAARHSMSYGYNWRNNLRSDIDKDIFDKISKMGKKEAEAVLLSHLNKINKNNKKDIDRYVEYLNKVFSVKLNEICEMLERLTGRKPYFENYIMRVTTFPRSPYDENEGSLFMQLNDRTPVTTFMHEALHFQFHNYWRKDSKSAVSKLSEDNFHYLKEALTVVLDNDVVPLIEFFDQGYPLHQDFRALLHKHWQAHHDFDELVNYGLQELKKFTKSAEK